MKEARSPLTEGLVIAETYEIERQLGRGGMGEVWLARHLRLAGKQVAIKVLHVDPQLPQEALARFKREAEIAARLEHPNIVQVSDFNLLPSGEPYLVMEYLKGQSLCARARGRTMGVEQVSIIMRQVGAALQAAHRAGVVHRDLKPENIFLVPTAVGDQVKVLDFGISKLSGSNTVQTTDSALIGTPLYMSPEQALGNNRDVSPQSDLFSLGSICYELFTGQAPFVSDNIAKVIYRIAYGKHEPLASLRPELPPSVIAAVEHLLEKERPRRTKDIDAFVLELTGQALVEISPQEAAGVYLPGMPETPSMGSGKTRGPGQDRAVSQAVSLAPAKTVSGRTLMLFLVGGSLAVAAVVTKVRMGNWAERAAYRAQMVDAGFVMLEDGNFVMDAGPIAQSPMLVIDAGTPAKIEEEISRESQVRPTAIEGKLLASLSLLQKEEKWDEIWEARSTIRSQLKTPSARAQGLSLVIESACARSDNAQLSSLVAEFKTVASSSQVRSSRLRCIKRYPSAAYLNW